MQTKSQVKAKPNAEPKAKHTPGPWIAKETSDGCLNITIGSQPISIYNRADAHLIAAAPDLLASLKLFLMFDFSKPIDISQAAQAIQLACDAVEEAEGR